VSGSTSTLLILKSTNKEGKLSQFENELVRKIPLHVQKYMEIHNTFAYDLEAEDFATRASIAVKTQQVLGTERFSLTETVGRRLSMVNMKDYIHEIKTKEYEQDRISEEGEEETKSESNTKMDSSLSESKEGNFRLLIYFRTSGSEGG
jgi:hypothetical protein